MAEEPTTDRCLNDFPDHLLLHLLSFLPTLDAIRTASLSRKWRNLWPTLSSLNFDYFLFPPGDSPAETRRLFADFVDRTLILRLPHSPLVKLRFQFDFREHLYRSHVDSWIRYAVSHGAVEIDIDFYINREYHIYTDADADEDCRFDFHFSVVGNSRVRALKLSRCDLILPIDMSGVPFKSIQSLYLDQIFLTDEDVSHLISGCSNLDSLVLEYCYGMKDLKIRSSKLKTLSLWYFHSQNEEEESVEICAPNLRSISIVCFEMGKYSFKFNDTRALVEAYVEFMHEEKHFKYWSKVVRLFTGVKRLVVENWWFRLCASMDLSSENLVFNNLTSLELRTGYTKYDLLGIAALLECTPNLQMLTLDDLFKIDEDESLSEELLNRPIIFNVASLSQVKIKKFTGTQNQVNLLRLMEEQGVILEKFIPFPEKGQASYREVHSVSRKRPGLISSNKAVDQNV